MEFILMEIKDILIIQEEIVKKLIIINMKKKSNLIKLLMNLELIKLKII
jgi:hypothetical protein